MRKPRKQKQATTPAGPETSATRRRWTAPEKSRIVRQHLRDGVTVADLAEQTGAAPGLIHTWIKLALERLEVALDDRRSPGDAEHARAVVRKDARIRRLEEVIVERSTEVLTLKNGRGASRLARMSRPRSRRRSWLPSSA